MMKDRRVKGPQKRRTHRISTSSESLGSSEEEPADRVPLKTILQNFLNHVQTLETQKGSHNNPEDLLGPTTTYEKEFQELKAFSDSLKSQSDFACKEGELEVNRKKNRYKDILPFDYTRVLLSDYPGVPGSDYINANYIKGASGSNAYIACQGPLPNTVNEFWRMVVETEVQVIIMACNEMEAGKHKCERYWCESVDECSKGDNAKNDIDHEEAQFGKFFVKVLKMREICPDFSVRTMQLRWTSEDSGRKMEDRRICQFHYSAWPDHGIPLQVKPLLEMVKLIRDCQASETLPVLVHCSAGCGRTGTICAIDFIWGLLRTGKLRSDFSLFELVKDMRRQRIAMVQTVDQYILVHRAVRELFLEHMRVIDSHPYENVDEDGLPLGSNINEASTEYETVFVENNNKQQGESEFDKILNQKMSQPRTVMGTAMLSRESKGMSKSDDNILTSPPKSRNAVIDQKAIDGRKINYDNSGDRNLTDLPPIESLFTQKSESVLFEPAKPPLTSKESSSAAQRFKKGNLRLTKVDNGSWKLEELEDKIEKKSKLKKKGKVKDSEDTGSKSELLRRPSIKKLRAFFNKEKYQRTAPPSTMAIVDSSEDSPQSDTEISSALAKMPKFEPRLDFSKSVPGSLDRKSQRNGPDYANVSSFAFEGSQPKANSWNARSLSSSQSNDKLATLGCGGYGNKPTLQVKRSKSMKTIIKPASILSRERSPSYNSKIEFKRSSPTIEYLSLPVESSSANHSRQGSVEENGKNLSRKSSSDYANMRMADYIDSPRKLENSGILKSYPPEYANFKVKSKSNNITMADEQLQILEQKLLQLHQRINSSSSSKDKAIPEDLKKSLPLIARSSDSLDLEARHMLKDYQTYLMSTFAMDEMEGDCLLRKPVKYYYSAESSPMTTLQKSNAHLFSSHSSPSNSYNKYKNNKGISSTHGAVQKSVSSPTGTIQKNFCSPAMRKSPKQGGTVSPEYNLSTTPTTSQNLYQKNALTSNDTSGLHSQFQQHQHYVNIGAARKELSTKDSKLSKSEQWQHLGMFKLKERRNSFREAVENKGYESIWFKHDHQFITDGDNNEEVLLVKKQDPDYVNNAILYPSPPTQSTQRGKPQQTEVNNPRRSWERSPSQPQISFGSLENSTFESGYEPIQLKDGNVTTSPMQRSLRSSESPGGSSRAQLSYQRLQSVSLVSEVLNNKNTGSSYVPKELSKQTSSSKLTQPQPPPYKEPPQPQHVLSQPYISSQANSYAQKLKSEQLYLCQPSHLIQPPAQLSNQKHSSAMIHSDSPHYDSHINAYANIEVSRRHSRDLDFCTNAKDDLMIAHRSKQCNRQSASQAATNRLSLGDFTAYTPQYPMPTANNDQNFSRMHGVPVEKSLQHQQKFHVRASGGSEPILHLNSFSASPPGIDIDQLAASMAQKKESPSSSHGNVTKLSQHGSRTTLTGVLSGAAANIKSKLSHLSHNSNINHGSNILVVQRNSPKFGEHSTSDIPVTVPGAREQNSHSYGKSHNQHFISPNFNKNSVCPLGYPHRIDSCPNGPQDAPSHFLKKQEYL